MSGIGHVKEDLNKIINTLVELDSSAIVVDDKGRYDTSARMAFSSGLHRVFKQEKSSEDVATNKRTLEFLLDQIYTHTNATSAEIEQIEAQTIRLGSEKEGASLSERLERGTYVSSDLVRQLAVIAGKVLNPRLEREATELAVVQQEKAQKQLELQQRREQEAETRKAADGINRQNNRELALAFGRMEVPTQKQKLEKQLDDGELLHRLGDNKIESALRTHRDGTETALTRALKEIEAGDRSGHPEAVWDTLDNYWTSGVGAQEGEREDLLKEWSRQIWLEGDAKAMKEGKGLSADEIKDMLKARMTSPEEMQKFVAIDKGNIETEQIRVNEANTRILGEITPQRLSDAVGRFLKDNPELEEKGRKLQDQLGDAGALQMTPRELRFSAIVQREVRGEEGGSDHPFQLVDQLRTGLRKAFEANPPTHELTTDHVAQLLGGTLSEILGKDEAVIDPAVRQQVETDLTDFYPELLEAARGAQASSINDLVRSLLMNQIEALAIQQALQSAKDDDKDLASRRTQQEAAEKAKQMIAKHREVQQKALAVLQAHVAFEREVKALSQQAGGLAGLPKATLERLDAERDRVKAGAFALGEYADMVKADFGDDAIKDIRGGLDLAVLTIATGSTYEADSGRVERERIAQVEKRLADVQAPDGAPYTKPDWMRPTMAALLAPHPALQNYVEGFDPNSNTRVKDNETFQDLVDSMVLDPIKREVYRKIQDEPSLNREQKAEKTKEHLDGMEAYWKNNVNPGLVMLTQYAKAPELTQPLTSENLRDYKMSLTQYVNGAKDAQRAMQQTGEELNALGNDVDTPTSKERCYKAGEAIVFAMNSLDDQIRYAQQKLDALG